jgi:hypothetical protein
MTSDLSQLPTYRTQLPRKAATRAAGVPTLVVQLFNSIRSFQLVTVGPENPSSDWMARHSGRTADRIDVAQQILAALAAGCRRIRPCGTASAINVAAVVIWRASEVWGAQADGGRHDADALKLPATAAVLGPAVASTPPRHCGMCRRRSKAPLTVESASGSSPRSVGFPYTQLIRKQLVGFNPAGESDGGPGPMAPFR